MVIARRPPGIAPMWVLTKHYEGVALLEVWGTGGCYRDQGAFGVDQEQQVGGLGEPAVGRLGGDAGTGGVAGGQGRAGEGSGEERFARSVGGTVPWLGASR